VELDAVAVLRTLGEKQKSSLANMELKSVRKQAQRRLVACKDDAEMEARENATASWNKPYAAPR
jgi:hypothetical protein